jgi:hypothetical protein
MLKLSCEDNQLQFLPKLPKSVVKLSCERNPWNPQFETQLRKLMPEGYHRADHGGWRLILYLGLNWGPEAVKEKNNKYVQAAAQYNHTMVKLKKNARKLILIHQGLLHNTRLNGDVLNVVCSFLSGTNGPLKKQLKVMEQVYTMGVVL